VATLFTSFICISCVVIGNLDLITPTITMFFLLCYAGVNLSCFLLDLLDAPSWRPRWKFHHWSLSLIGAFLCIGMLPILLLLILDHPKKSQSLSCIGLPTVFYDIIKKWSPSVVLSINKSFSLLTDDLVPINFQLSCL
jgi:hypothetical protein